MSKNSKFLIKELFPWQVKHFLHSPLQLRILAIIKTALSIIITHQGIKKILYLTIMN